LESKKNQKTPSLVTEEREQNSYAVTGKMKEKLFFNSTVGNY
jgi:hypothetical protein